MFAPRNSCPSDFRRKLSKKHESTQKDCVGRMPNKAPLNSLRCSESLTTSTESAVSVFETATMIEAFRSCNIKNVYILVLGKRRNLVGIITSTDIVYRVIAYGLDPSSTLVGQIMTRNPVVASDSTDSNHALMLMVSHKIKHLPICNRNGDIVRVLRLTDVFNDYLEDTCRKLDASETLYNAVLSAETSLGTNESLARMLASARELVQKSFMPNFSMVVADQGQPISVGPRYTVRRVAQIMKYQNASLVCIVDHPNPDQNEDRASRGILGLCALKDIAFHFIKFGTVASKNNISRFMKNSGILKVHSSTSFREVAQRMLRGHFSDTLVEMMDSTFSIVSILTISAALVRQGDQNPSYLGRHMDTAFHDSSHIAEAKRTASRSPSAKDDSRPLPHLACTDNDCSGRTVPASDHGTNIGQASDCIKNDVPRFYEAPPEYTPEVKSHKLPPLITTDTVKHSLLAYPLQGHQALLDLKKHYDVFRGYFSLKDFSVAHLNRSATRHKIVVLSSVQLFELSTDVYDELLRRQKAWRDEYTTPFLPGQAGFSSARNQDRQRLSSLSPSHFQDLVEEVYNESSQRYPALREDFPITHAMIVAIARLADILKDVSQYRRLLGLRTWKAKQLLNFFQFALDMPGLLPELRRNFLVATQRLSKCSGLYPACYDLKAIELTGDHPVASGGFADIYKGNCGGHIVCLKVIRVYQNSHLQSFLKRISSEAILWGQLQHPNILPFYGVYYFNNRTCLVSPWLDQDVNCFLSDNPDVNRRLLVSDVASGVAFLHSRDIVHGDLKGANILVNKFQRANIADFGLSSVSDSNILHWASHSTAASKGGSVRWQAPELFDDVNDEVIHNSKASDVYAFSCVTYEIFTGKLPFFELGKLEATILLNVKAGARPSCPTDLSPAWWPMRLTRSFWTLMESCWHPHPAERPSIDIIIAHTDLKGVDTRPGHDPDTIFADSRHFVASRSNPPSFQAIQEILIDLERLNTG